MQPGHCRCMLGTSSCVRTQRQSEKKQAEAAEIQRRLLVDFRRCVQGNGEQQQDSRESWTPQECQQDRTQNKVAYVYDACPHGCQTQTCKNQI